MIVLDTDVLSELMKPPALVSGAVVSWFARVRPEAAFTTTITVAEIRSGLAFMPDGRRKEEKTAMFERVLAAAFGPRILPFDLAAAASYASIVAARRREGLGGKPLDHLIAAIAQAAGMMVATRNLRDFSGCGVAVVDPWTD
ncbi:type II toxin-antitoxin system VapC family toxin [Prosthecomicrobium pneumaticum]|uniref:Ribonuclease VapC n=1 Tax=Prosthecomicrobium pneumaticum TaxID=81895 RepID=A0A7W9L263_9HYPH|nr:type II toxin-antitoxin system VapC family toxin [Prosthecomicrobium pneumaticum]MBB5753247.1 hypothetical protein [Prosthecomicrobium pneumaticum]